MGLTEDRRRWPRFRLSWTLWLLRAGERNPVGARTENISCGGFYCITCEAFSPGEHLECRLDIPKQGSDEPQLSVWLRAEVLRVERQTVRGGFGVACQILDYRVLPKTRHADREFSPARPDPAQCGAA